MFSLTVSSVIQVIVLLDLLRSILFNLKLPPLLWWDSVLLYQGHAGDWISGDLFIPFVTVDLRALSSVLSVTEWTIPGPLCVQPWNFKNILRFTLIFFFYSDVFWSTVTNIAPEISTLWLWRRVLCVNYYFFIV